MSDKIQEMKLRLKEQGYFASDSLAKMILLFEAAGKRDSKNIPTLLLEGKSGAGKTFLAETFAKIINADERFVQCFPRMGAENFQYDVDIESIIKQDAENSIKEGILLQALEQSKESPVVLVIDELDKARPDVDSFLLDFLENGRLTTGTDTYEKGEYPIYTFITSNNKREIDDALLNRSRKLYVPRPSKSLFLEILNLPQDHYMGYIYEQCPDFSIRQARQYLQDLEVLGKEIDEESLSLYVDFEELKITSIADIERIQKIKSNDINTRIPRLRGSKIKVNSENEQTIRELLSNGNPYNFRLYTADYDAELYLDIETIEQLKFASKYIEFDDYENRYRGWFEFSLSDKEMDVGEFVWASNVSESENEYDDEYDDEYKNKHKNEQSETRLGVKIYGDNLFRIAMNNGRIFVYLDSDTESVLENFLVKEKDVISQDSINDTEIIDTNKEPNDLEEY